VLELAHPPPATADGRAAAGPVPQLAELAGAGAVHEAVAVARAAGLDRLVLTVEPATPELDRVTAAAGLTVTRELLQLRRTLPVGEPWELDVRPFDPQRDGPAWVAVNNRAFAWHPEQSGWTLDDLAARETEPWFDPAGFLLHEVDGRLAGFCWTKVHAHEDPPLGEIYVIGVDPDHQGRGLGRPLTLAGLDHLADQGIEVGMLYVEADNVPARRLYDDLGFTTHRARRWYSIDLAPPSP
jgi:mycothiol synthase